MLFDFALEYAISSGKPGLLEVRLYTLDLVYGDDVYILRGSVQTLKKNAEALVAASKETGLEVNADKAKCMVMTRDRNAERSQSIKTDNSSFESVEGFKYLGTILTIKILFRKKLRAE